ncbi:unnamed protein product [Victoria cruziana]
MEGKEELSRVITYSIFSKLEKKWLAGRLDTDRVRILCIDGGGLRAIAAGRALVHLEQRLRADSGEDGARIADYFDVVAGTGIGGVLAAMIVADGGGGRPLFTAEEAVRTLAEGLGEVFRPEGFFRRGRSGRRFDRFLREVFTRDGRALTLRDTVKPVLVPCYDLRSGAPFVFSRADAAESASFDFELWRVCRATAATPGSLGPVRLESVDGRTACAAVDGGLVMNNPSAAAVTHVLHNKRDFPNVDGVGDLLLLSVGCGPVRRSPAVAGGSRRWWRGGVWSKPVVEIVMDGVSDTVDQVIGNAFSWNRSNYLRIQANGFHTKDMEAVMEDSSTKGVAASALMAAGERMLKEKAVESLPFGGKRVLADTNGQLLDKFAHALVESSRNKLITSPSKLPGYQCTEEALQFL